MIQPLYALWIDHPKKSSNHVSLCIVTTTLLTMFLMLYKLHPSDLFFKWKFLLLNPLLQFLFFTCKFRQFQVVMREKIMWSTVQRRVWLHLMCSHFNYFSLWLMRSMFPGLWSLPHGRPPPHCVNIYLHRSRLILSNLLKFFPVTLISPLYTKGFI